MEKSTELEWLQYFYSNIDLGPGDDDARNCIKEDFCRETGKALPEGYEVS